MLNRTLTALMWLLVLTSPLAWWQATLRQGASAPATSSVDRPAPPVSLTSLQRLLGAVALAAIEAPADASLHLSGVIASPSGTHRGTALISIDGKPTQAYPVGAPIQDQLVLQSVGTRSAQIGPASGKTAFVLELPTASASAPASTAGRH